jgi:tyrosine phenol-lyase
MVSFFYNNLNQLTGIMEKTKNEGTVKFFNGKELPLEMHKVRIVQSIKLVPIERRLEAIREAGFNTFLLGTKDIFLDMLTDSGTNAMSDEQLSKMFVADAYAGSQSFVKFEKSVAEVFGKKMVLPVHQGRAAENIISQTFVRKGSVIPMNYHFTTTLAHIQLNGGTVVELYTPEAMVIKSTHPFKGNIDVARLEELIIKNGAENVPFIRMEASTNLIGGQPFSMENLKEVRKVADK